MSALKCLYSDAAGPSNVVALASYSDLKTILGQCTDSLNEILKTKKGAIVKRIGLTNLQEFLAREDRFSKSKSESDLCSRKTKLEATLQVIDDR